MSQETQETKQLPVPSLTAEQVQVIMNYANEQLPTKYGKEILAFIEKVAIELDRASQTNVEEAQIVDKTN
jgi:hypothetical protein